MLGELQKQKLTKVFRIWDTDSNGFLELEDWTRVERKRAELAGISPGTPEYENVRKLYTLIWETLRAFADTNRDERVSLDEFLTFCDKQWGDVQEVSFEALPDQIRGVLGAGTLEAFRGRLGCGRLAEVVPGLHPHHSAGSRIAAWPPSRRHSLRSTSDDGERHRM